MIDEQLNELRLAVERANERANRAAQEVRLQLFPVLRDQQAEIDKLKSALKKAQHYWKLDDIDQLEKALYEAGDFKKES
jgi:hypothetical protein